MRRLLAVIAIALAAWNAVPAQAAQAPDTLVGKPARARPPHHVAFPAIGDWNTLNIGLSRTMCFGACPAYAVEILGDGTVTWHGGSNVATLGNASATVAKADVRALYRAFRRADFFWLYDSYRAPITDLPTYTVTISYDGHVKSVADYAGLSAGMPRAVVDLEAMIDKVANTQQWIKPAP